MNNYKEHTIIYNKYTKEEIELCIGQECFLGYEGSMAKGIILKVFNNGYNDLVMIQQIKNNHVQGGYFIDRIQAIPMLDKIKDKKLWKLIRPCTE